MKAPWKKKKKKTNWNRRGQNRIPHSRWKIRNQVIKQLTDLKDRQIQQY